jgi:MFS family permease
MEAGAFPSLPSSELTQDGNPMQNADAPKPPTLQPHETGKRVDRSAMMIVFLVVFIDLLGFGIVLPLLPRIGEAYAQQVFPRPAWMVGMVVGLLMSSFSLMQFLFAPVWGRLSDRVGRRPILLIGLLGSVLFYTLFGYATSLEPTTSAAFAMVLFFVARIGAGVSGATIATAQAVIADCTPPEKRKHGMALIGAAFGIGFTFGPLIGFGCLKFSSDLSLVGYSAASLSLVALILGLNLLKETRVFSNEAVGRRVLLDWPATRQTLTNPAIGPVILTFFIASLGFGAFEVTLALFLKDSFGFGPDDSFLIFAYVGFVLMLTQGVLYRRLASRVSEVTFMGMGILFMAIGVALLGWITYSVSIRYQTEILPILGASTVGRMATPLEQGALLAICELFVPRDPERWLIAFLFIALTAAVIGFAFMTPSAQALISRRTSSERQGEILGVNQSASAMARILGPIFGLTLYMSTATHLLPYIAGAILLVSMLPMLPRIRRGR